MQWEGGGFGVRPTSLTLSNLRSTLDNRIIPALGIAHWCLSHRKMIKLRQVSLCLFNVTVIINAKDSLAACIVRASAPWMWLREPGICRSRSECHPIEPSTFLDGLIAFIFRGAHSRVASLKLSRWLWASLSFFMRWPTCIKKCEAQTVSEGRATCGRNEDGERDNLLLHIQATARCRRLSTNI
jgi:hypothetical protein